MKLIERLINEATAVWKNPALTSILKSSLDQVIQSGASEKVVFENAIQSVLAINESIKSPEIDLIVDKFKKLNQTAAQKVQDFSSGMNLSTKLKNLSESTSDPILKAVCDSYRATLSVCPEYKILSQVAQKLNSFANESKVGELIGEIVEYVNENSSKLYVLDCIQSLKVVPGQTYSQAVSVLEHALAEDALSVDSISISLGYSKEFPVIKRMLNTLQLLESKKTGAFGIGTGSGDLVIKNVIAPATKFEKVLYVMLENAFFKMSEDSIELVESTLVRERVPIFYEYAVNNFYGMRFASDAKNEAMCAKIGGINLEFRLNENHIETYFNGKNISEVDLSSALSIERPQVKMAVTKILDNKNFIIGLDFIKIFENHRTGSKIYAVNMQDSVYLLDHSGSRKLTKLAFYNFMKENYNYDVSALYSVVLEQRDDIILKIKNEKIAKNKDIIVLEGDLKKIETAMTVVAPDSDLKMSLEELKEAINKNIYAAKERIIALDRSAQKLFEADGPEVPAETQYNVSDKVLLKDGRNGVIQSYDASTQTYMTVVSDAEVLPIKADQIDKSMAATTDPNTAAPSDDTPPADSTVSSDPAQMDVNGSNPSGPSAAPVTPSAQAASASASPSGPTQNQPF